MLEGALHAVFELLVGLPRQDEQVILDPVLHAAVAGGRDTPVEDQVEIAEGLPAEQIFAVARLRRRLEAAVIDGPAVSRRRVLARVDPSCHGLSIEQQYPA